LITQRDSLVPSVPLARFVARSLGLDLETFGQLYARRGIRARTMAVCMETGELVAFGDQDEDRLIDGAMSSTAVPPYLPPWRAGGRRFLDGSVLSKLPLLSAIERGATQILALNMVSMLGGPKAAHGMRGIAGYAISLGIEEMTAREVDLARRTGVELHLLNLHSPPRNCVLGLLAGRSIDRRRAAGGTILARDDAASVSGSLARGRPGVGSRNRTAAEASGWRLNACGKKPRAHASPLIQSPCGIRTPALASPIRGRGAGLRQASSLLGQTGTPRHRLLTVGAGFTC
jgi:hypothetical protein